MAGSTITATEAAPATGKKMIYFTVTLDGDKKADFSAYERVEWINASDASTGANEAVAANTAGGDITFTNASNAIKGVALVVVQSAI